MKNNIISHGSLFSGIGGFDLAAQWMGWDNVFHCEINPFGQKILKYYWPNAISYDDITKTDFTVHRGKITVLTGGFPCQPFSVAGKRKGTEDARNLWPEYHRAIREIQPAWVVGENVPGLISWSKGMVFEQVQTDLENEGYEVWPFILPACSVGAPHRRDRIWFVAYSESIENKWNGSGRLFTKSAGFNEQGAASDTDGLRRLQEYELQQSELHKQYGEKRPTPNTKSERMERIGGNEQQEPRSHGKTGLFVCSDTGQSFQNFPTQPPVCNGDDGFSARLGGITFPKWRNESIKAGGNAIVPQVALSIFSAIGAIHNNEDFHLS